MQKQVSVSNMDVRGAASIAKLAHHRILFILQMTTTIRCQFQRSWHSARFDGRRLKLVWLEHQKSSRAA